MKQYDLINSLIDVLVKNDMLDCAFVMGSFARGKEDDYSNIDLYLKLNIYYEDSFFNNDYRIFESYRKIIFFEKKDNHIYNIIYDDDINLIVHLTNLKDFEVTNDILKVYDPNNMLSIASNYSLEYSSKEIGNIINDLSLDCFNFIRFNLRYDLPIMFDTALSIFKKYSIILRYSKDPNSSKLKLKEILSVLTFDERKRYVEILSNLKLDSLLNAVKMILDDLSDVITKLDVNVAMYYDYDFLMYVKRKINIL